MALRRSAYRWMSEWKAVLPFVTHKAINYPVLIGGRRVAQLYGSIDSLPSTFLIDREGRIASVHLGLVSNRVTMLRFSN